MSSQWLKAIIFDSYKVWMVQGYSTLDDVVDKIEFKLINLAILDYNLVELVYCYNAAIMCKLDLIRFEFSFIGLVIASMILMLVAIFFVIVVVRMIVIMISHLAILSFILKILTLILIYSESLSNIFINSINFFLITYYL